MYALLTGFLINVPGYTRVILPIDNGEALRVVALISLRNVVPE
jgi:hypothetical protein